MKMILMSEDQLKKILAEAWSNGSSNAYMIEARGYADYETEKECTIEDILFDLSRNPDVLIS